MATARTGLAGLNRKLWHILPIAVLLVTTGLLLLLNFGSQYDPRNLLSSQGETEKYSSDGDISVIADPPAPEPTSEFYDWRTSTAYNLVDISENLTQEELCQHFPKQKLSKIQPVLKTGHQVLDRVRQSLLSTSACLDNLLIFSDFDEELEGRAVINVIADIDEALLRSDNQTDSYFALQEAAAKGTDDEDMEAVEGWLLDKFKFLASVSRAWKMSPEKQWHVFYEGDTYVVWDTVFRLPENFDADGEHYFGSPSPGRDGTWFANGGPGYILSRGAVRKLVRDDWNHNTGEWLGSKLSEKYWEDILTDCCGDSILGWVLHVHGIDLKGLWPMFNPHPLHGIPFSDLYWCQPVLSMHKSWHKEEIDFWKWEWTQRQAHRPLLWRDIATSYFNLTSVPRKDDWDNAGWDAYSPAEDDLREPHSSAEACSLACREAEDSGCFQWTYHLRRCSFVRSFRLGRARKPHIDDQKKDHDWTQEDQKYFAGWNTEHIKRWISKRPCSEVQWVRPSIERIF
ncbi:glycosyltransferase family 31 protein [Zasmidium cellare ATCC 36951]|uniref:Glycosyltransferase family 31 protein n=1 Tax=Zasmidium cellare ATCC 36951 TaxID=1080233 RepID=A0A6A6CLF6_ZASCE|nr:glycosyltransferase family 31 protein [Zasmidium cellare ATCC 36951]KAF2168014.1 glycosyltransferase family 31 protein [Zasmidium cellare ATCC 36951]